MTEFDMIKLVTLLSMSGGFSIGLFVTYGSLDKMPSKKKMLKTSASERICFMFLKSLAGLLVGFFVAFPLVELFINGSVTKYELCMFAILVGASSSYFPVMIKNRKKLILKLIS